ncbi:M18 family aminopeptidase [Phytohalomonas tamaricis]|uniref:M18 family aminopeptidase n=1 Tax=Phytohalomonas tamaricis TaxID=2081032 RepID=UPI000D0B6CAA|nr:M18 family aminopeptidase [Phytohalomonas tamaricis]
MFNSNTLMRLFDFLHSSPMPWHAVKQMTERLDAAGFKPLDEVEAWSLVPGGRYYTVRNGSSLIAFQLPQCTLESLRMIGAHTDSPGLRLKPRPTITSRSWLQLGIEVYGGALLAPWFDRDLGLAGRVHVRKADGTIEGLLINVDRPVAIIPSLAIHLDREVNQGKALNAQTQMAPILWQMPEQMQAESEHHDIDTLLKRWIKEQHNIDQISILDFELGFYDVQPPSQLGIEGELIASARLDNLLSCFCGLEALLQSDGTQGVLFVANDHEEVGSASASGAHGTMLADVLHRLNDAVGVGGEEGRVRLIQRSRMISCDNAHGLHPNFADKHDAAHGPKLNAGPVIKVNANQRYATNSATAAMFRDICHTQGVPVQTFVTRADMGCGSTIGPITASEIGVPTIDVGLPQWAMHSIRETAGAHDPDHLIHVLSAFCNRAVLD